MQLILSVRKVNLSMRIKALRMLSEKHLIRKNNIQMPDSELRVSGLPEYI